MTPPHAIDVHAGPRMCPLIESASMLPHSGTGPSHGHSSDGISLFNARLGNMLVVLYPVLSSSTMRSQLAPEYGMLHSATGV